MLFEISTPSVYALPGVEPFPYEFPPFRTAFATLILPFPETALPAVPHVEAPPIATSLPSPLISPLLSSRAFPPIDVVAILPPPYSPRVEPLVMFSLPFSTFSAGCPPTFLPLYSPVADSSPRI